MPDSYLIYPEYDLFLSADDAHERLVNLTRAILVEDDYRRKKIGKRSRTKDTALKIQYYMYSLFVNFIKNAQNEGSLIAVSRSKCKSSYSRYLPSFVTPKIAVASMDILIDQGFIEIEIGTSSFIRSGRRLTTIQFTSILKSLLSNIPRSPFAYLPSRETIVLKTRYKETDFGKAKTRGFKKEYNDSKQTILWREQVESINDFLANSDIAFSGKQLSVHERFLVRYFNEEFGRGGRLFGGAWLSMPKAARTDLRINGESLAEIDIKACNLSLAYSKLGVSIDELEEDPYDIDVDGRKVVRGGVKKVILAMLCAEQKLTSFPRGTRNECGVSRSTKFEDVERAVLEKHKPIAHLFYRGYGMYLQFEESEILIRTLLKLKDLGITALPIHDCILVPESTSKTALEVFRETFREQTSVYPKLVITNLQ